MIKINRIIAPNGIVSGKFPEFFTAKCVRTESVSRVRVAVAAAQDAAGVKEMREFPREAMWQLKDIVLEVRRRLAADTSPDPVRQVVSRRLDRAVAG